MELLVALGFWLLCAYVGKLIGESKGRGDLGFGLGFLFGPIGILIIALFTKTEEKISEEERQRHRPVPEYLNNELKKLQSKVAELEQKVPKERGWAVACGSANVEMTATQIRIKLENGELTPQDQYFDDQTATWQPLHARFTIEGVS